MIGRRLVIRGSFNYATGWRGGAYAFLDSMMDGDNIGLLDMNLPPSICQKMSEKESDMDSD